MWTTLKELMDRFGATLNDPSKGDYKVFYDSTWSWATSGLGKIELNDKIRCVRIELIIHDDSDEL